MNSDHSKKKHDRILMKKNSVWIDSCYTNLLESRILNMVINIKTNMKPFRVSE
jgi:hypothetical protein